MALIEGVAFISLQANTHRSMTHDSAFGVLATGAWTRVLATQIDACEIASTFGVIDAFGFAIWWISEVVW